MNAIGFMIVIGIIYGLAVTLFVFLNIFKKYIEMGDSKATSYDFSGVNMRFISKHS